MPFVRIMKFKFFSQLPAVPISRAHSCILFMLVCSIHSLFD